MFKAKRRSLLVVLNCLCAVMWSAGCRSEENFQGQIGERCDSNLDCKFELHCQEQTSTCQVDVEEEPEGIATDETDIWIVDKASDMVFRYDGAAARTEGAAAPDASFSLVKGNKNPRGITTDGSSLWEVNDGKKKDKVFKYDVGGELLGKWTIDSANTSPRGITIDPGNVDHVWIVDIDSDSIYQIEIPWWMRCPDRLPENRI